MVLLTVLLAVAAVRVAVAAQTIKLAVLLHLGKVMLAVLVAQTLLFIVLAVAVAQVPLVEQEIVAALREVAETEQHRPSLVLQ